MFIYLILSIQLYTSLPWMKFTQNYFWRIEFEADVPYILYSCNIRFKSATLQTLQMIYQICEPILRWSIYSIEMKLTLKSMQNLYTF